MGIHISYKIGAVQRIFQRVKANTRCRMGTHINFYAKRFTNISLKGKKLCSTRAGPKSRPDQNPCDRTTPVNDINAQRANVTSSMNSKLCNSKPHV